LLFDKSHVSVSEEAFSMTVLKIGLDFDGVIGNSHPLKPRLTKEMFGVEISERDFRREYVIGEGLLTPEQYKIIGHEVFRGKYSIPPVDDSLYYIELLKRHNHIIHVITSRSGDTLEPAKRFLATWGLEDVPLTGVGYGLSKKEACCGLHVYIDDDLEKLIPLVGVVPHLILFSRPENENEHEPGGITRLSSWWAIYDYIWNEVRI